MPCCGVKKNSPIDEVLDPFKVSQEALVDVLDRMDAAMTRGLKQLEDYDVRMFPTYIASVPNSKEKGRYLSMDLGINKLVISLVELRGKHISFKREGRTYEPDTESKPTSLVSGQLWHSHGIDSKRGTLAYESLEVYLPDEFRTYDGDKFFQYLVDRLNEFLSYSKRVPLGSIALGFNFPCPVRPLGPASGIVTNWTKSYNVGDVLGKDVAKLLQDALDKNKLSHIRVSVLLNDTMATLLAGSYGPSTQSVLVGVMLGTATNCVYQQSIDQIDMISEHKSAMDFLRSTMNPEKTMIIDTEWGAFGESSGDLDSLRTPVDDMVDKGSGNPGRDTLTKLVCGLYTGEIVRLILAKLHTMNYLLPNRDVPFLGIAGKWKMNHLHMSSVETDRGITFSATKKVLQDLGMEADVDTCRVVKKVCEAVTCRSASLAGAILAAVIRRIPRELVTVAIDGSLLRCHPTYRKRLEDSIDKMLKMRPSKLVARQSFVLKLITDGAIVGAGIAAACQQRDLNGNRTASITPTTSAFYIGANKMEVMNQKTSTELKL